MSSTPLAAPVRQFLSNAEQIGLARTAQFRVLARMGVSEIRIPVSGLDAPVFCRVSDSDIWDIGAVAAFFNLSNRMANLAAMRPNPEFYSMGRDQGGEGA